MSLYLWINILSISVPFLFSFHPRIKFTEKWKWFFPAMAVSAITYLSWDVIFTMNGYWGFNPEYLQGIDLLYLPIEEWLFFICIPYASIFTHYTLVKLYPNVRLSDKSVGILTPLLIVVLVGVALFNLDKAYTAVNFLLTGSVLLIAWRTIPSALNQFYLTFLVVLVPFFIVNGVLTGSFIKDEVVWYNNAENLGIRMFTIPIEDTFYAMGMLLITVLLMELSAKKAYATSSASANL